MMTSAGHSLTDADGPKNPLTIDFTSNKLRHRTGGGGRDLLVRAVGAKPGLRVVDCTAGVGTDSFVLAAKGCEVMMIERSNTLYLMLESALRVAETSDVAEIAARMSVIRGDARFILAHLDEPPDVITIDPMFPERRKSAQVKGEFQVLQHLLGKDEDVDSLLAAALETGCRRVVIKRPSTAPVSGRPEFSVKGRAARLDVYVKA